MGNEVLIWPQRVEVQRVQKKKALDEMKSVKYFDHIQRGKKTEIAQTAAQGTEQKVRNRQL